MPYLIKQCAIWSNKTSFGQFAIQSNNGLFGQCAICSMRYLVKRCTTWSMRYLVQQCVIWSMRYLVKQCVICSMRYLDKQCVILSMRYLVNIYLTSHEFSVIIYRLIPKHSRNPKQIVEPTRIIPNRTLGPKPNYNRKYKKKSFLYWGPFRGLFKFAGPWRPPLKPPFPYCLRYTCVRYLHVSNI